MRRVLMLSLLLAVVACLIAVQAFSQSPGSSMPAATATPANPSPQTVHYHYHYHYHYAPPVSSLMYPSYYANPYNGMASNASYPLPPTAFSPTQANPYPPGYIPGPYAPLSFQNFNPNAPSTRA